MWTFSSIPTNQPTNQPNDSLEIPTWWIYGFGYPGSKGSPPELPLPQSIQRRQRGCKKKTTPPNGTKMHKNNHKKTWKRFNAQLESQKNHLLFSMEKFPDSSPASPKSTLINCQSDAMDAPRRPFFFLHGARGQVGWRHWPGAKRPRKEQKAEVTLSMMS